MQYSVRGFTLIELLLVVAILAILGSIGFGFYGNTTKDVEITEISKQIMSDVRGARSSAIAGQKDRAWGIHFTHTATSSYYQMYSTPTNYSDPAVTIENSVNLTNGISFSDPAQSFTKDVLFSRVSGTTTATTVTLTSQLESITVTISSLGVVY